MSYHYLSYVSVVRFRKVLNCFMSQKGVRTAFENSSSENAVAKTVYKKQKLKAIT